MARWDKIGPNRRAFLGGTGAALIGLPMLASLAHATTGTTTPPRRLLFWYLPNGIRLDRWTPTTTGNNYALTDLLQPFAALRSKILVLSNLGMEPAQVNAGGDHARGTGAFLTGRQPPAPPGAIALGPSIDHLASLSPCADNTLFRSLHLASDVQPTAGSCDSGYPCAYQNSITWSGPTTPVAPRTDAVAVFNALFGTAGTGIVEAAAAQRRHARRRSVLDQVTAEATTLQGRLSVDDRMKVDEYLTGVRELEVRLANNPPNGGDPVCNPGTLPGDPGSFAGRVDNFVDLMVKAVECDSTRVLSFMADISGSYRSFHFAGIPESHHNVSHWGIGTVADQQAKLDFWQGIQAWHLARLADLLTQLEARTEADGTTLLDNCAVYFSSEIGDGHSHDHLDLPVLVAGGLQGTIDTGRHHRFASRERVNNLFMGLLDRFGAPQTAFGDDGLAVMPGVFI